MDDVELASSSPQSPSHSSIVRTPRPFLPEHAVSNPCPAHRKRLVHLDAR
jgi:hypothetical protein